MNISTIHVRIGNDPNQSDLQFAPAGQIQTNFVPVAPGTGTIQAAWYSVIDNVAQLNRFFHIDVSPAPASGPVGINLTIGANQTNAFMTIAITYASA
jgi:hypothetical protein